MQIDNPNGNVILLDKIDVNQNRVVYSRYDYGLGKFLEQKARVFTTITLQDYLTLETVYETLCYNTLIAEVEPAYVLSEELQNWLFPSASDRVYVPALTYNTIVNSGNELDLLIQQYVADDWVALSEGIHYYRDTVNEEEQLILEQYPDIIIEEKI